MSKYVKEENPVKSGFSSLTYYFNNACTSAIVTRFPLL